MPTNNEILTGVRVLDFTTIVSGPYCTRLLADLGAEIIKVEPPEGDFIRVQPPLRGGRSAYFAHLNCGKKSLAVDLRQAGAVELMHELASRSDVIVENSRPGVMQRLGLDYPTLAKPNPRLVHCSISGFGQEGPWATRSAYAPMLHAASGVRSRQLVISKRPRASVEYRHLRWRCTGRHLRLGRHSICTVGSRADRAWRFHRSFDGGRHLGNAGL